MPPPFSPLDPMQLASPRQSAIQPEPTGQLLTEYPDVLSTDGFSTALPRHGIFYNIKTNPGPSVFAKTRRLDCQSRVSQDGGCWDYPLFRFPMGQSYTYGS